MIATSKIQSFKKWLEARGCEIFPVTNEYELLRFKGKETGVVYSSGKTSNQYTRHAFFCFSNPSEKWDGAPIKELRQTTYRKEKRKLLERDGDICFLCGLKLFEDITIEHLIALASGGKNSLDNMVLMHRKCNELSGTLPISEKVKLALNNRLNLTKTDKPNATCGKKLTV